QTTAGWNQIDSVDTPDALTAVVHLQEAFVPFVPTTLTFPVLPKHALEGVKDPGNSEFARKPLGNGSFKFKEWVPGDHITVVASPTCPIQPKAESIVFKFVPDINTLLALIRTGDVDVANDFGEAQASEVDKIDGVKLIAVPGVNIERYYFNMRDPKDLSKPHPIFSDMNVRKAIAMATDRFTAVDTVLQGFGKPAVTEVDNTPWSNTDLQPVPYDPEAAKKLLDEAGWKVGPSGIREKDGVKLSFRHSTTAGNQTRENLQLLFQQNLKDIGAEMVIENYPAATLFGGCANNGVFGTGNFDVLGFANKPTGIDLAAEWSDFFMSSAIKDCATNPAGTNAWGFADEGVDAEFAKVLSELDPDKRLVAIKNVQKLIYDQYQVLYVYDRSDFYAVSDRVTGVNPTVFGGHSYNFEQWAIK
ncbi:MAG TPA: peptide ABC transporter substrate-binding protein, partial [Anaerolineae bacterium]|nr:peptide ABC transporter substrate-binding protein [Anaerolineae bacterium]